MSVENRIKLEKKIVRKIVSKAIKNGWSVSVNDGEEWVVKRSSKVGEVMKAVMSTDEDQLRLRDSNDDSIGFIYLVYGNSGYDVISDYTANNLMEEFLADIQKFAEQYDVR